MKEDGRGRLKFYRGGFAGSFQRDRLLKGLLQIGGVLSLLALMCIAICCPAGLAGKGTAGASAGEKRSGVPEAYAHGKKLPESTQESCSFGALYGLGEYDVPEKQLDFEALRQEDNPHIYAWITIPGTHIDYPVLQHPEQQDYYLTHNLDGSVGYPGCIYTQCYNSMDWSDNETVLYGHNMKDGTMFSGLHAYEEEAFFEENPYIYIYTEDRLLVYRVFAAYAFSDEHLLLNYDTETEEGYRDYLQEVRRAAESGGHFDEAAAPAAKDRIITLSTCIVQRPEQRYLVQGVLAGEGRRRSEE